MPIIIFEISQTKAWEIWNKAPPPNNKSYPYSATSHTDAFPKNLMKNVIYKKKNEPETMSERNGPRSEQKWNYRAHFLCKFEWPRLQWS